jgi:hypothetical protein
VNSVCAFQLLDEFSRPISLFAARAGAGFRHGDEVQGQLFMLMSPDVPGNSLAFFREFVTRISLNNIPVGSVSFPCTD